MPKQAPEWRLVTPEEVEELEIAASHLRELDERDQLDAINARYQHATQNATLASAVENALKEKQPNIKSFEGLVRMLQAFDSMIPLPLQLH